MWRFKDLQKLAKCVLNHCERLFHGCEQLTYPSLEKCFHSQELSHYHILTSHLPLDSIYSGVISTINPIRFASDKPARILPGLCCGNSPPAVIPQTANDPLFLPIFRSKFDGTNSPFSKGFLNEHSSACRIFTIQAKQTGSLFRLSNS